MSATPMTRSFEPLPIHRSTTMVRAQVAYSWVGRSFVPSLPSGDIGTLPSRIGEFAVHGSIGSGGMGDVFVGYDPRLERHVAIKRIRKGNRATDEARRETFRKEARLAAQLSHTGVVAVYDVCTIDDVDYIISEFIDGPSLDRVISRRTHWQASAGEESLRMATEVLDALAHAHQSGVLHLDVKAENILVTKFGGAIRLTDFGLARSLLGSKRCVDQAIDPEDSTPMGVVGTPRSVAPEMLQEAEIDERADVFSYGVLLYEMFSGLSPFLREDVAQTMLSIQRDEPRPLHAYVQGIPRELSDLVDRLLAKPPAARPTLAQARDVLERVRREVRGSRAGVTASSFQASELQLAIGVVRIDVRGETTSVEQRLELARRLSAIHEWLIAALECAGGMMVNESGNHFVFCLGYPLAHENNGFQAAKLLLDGLGELTTTQWSAGSGARVSAALDTGLALLVRGNRGPRVSGQVVDDAFALSLCAEPGELLVSPAAHNLLRRFFQFIPNVCPYTLSDGRTAPASRLVRMRPEPNESFAPMIGRDDELLSLDRAWFSAQRGHGCVVLLIAAPGLGKSRLASTWTTSLPRETRVLTLRGIPEESHVPFGALRRWALSWLDLPSGVSASELHGASKHALERWESLGANALEGLRILLEIGPYESTAEFEEKTADRDPEVTLVDGPVALVQSATGHGPAVIVAEDIHWMDKSTLKVLEHLSRKIPSSPIVMLVTGRPGVDVRWLPAHGLIHLDLDPLDYDASCKLVAAFTAMNPLPARVVDQLARRAGGIPLLIEELASTFSFGGPIEERLMPTSLRDSVQRKVAGLGAVRRTLEALAVLGSDAPAELLEELTLQDKDSLEAQMAEASRSGLVRMDGQRAAFRHALIRDAIYEGMGAGDRHALHGVIVDLLDHRFREVVEARPGRYAHHYEVAGRIERSLALREAAGVRASQVRAYQDASEHIHAALRVLVGTPESASRDNHERRLRCLLGPIMIAVEGWSAPNVQENYARTHALARRHGDIVNLGEIWGRWGAALVAHDSSVLRECHELIAQAPRSPEQRFMRNAMLGMVASHEGELVAAVHHLSAASRAVLGTLEGRLLPEDTLDLGIAQEWQEDVLGAPSAFLAVVYAYQGMLPEADRAQADSERIGCRSESLAFARAYAYGCRVVHTLVRRDPSYLEPILEPLRSLCGGTHPWLTFPRALLQIGEGFRAVVEDGARSGAEKISSGVQTLKAMGFRLTVELHAAQCADAWRTVNDIEQARPYIELAEELCAHELARLYAPEVHLAAARLHRACGDTAAETASLDRAQTAIGKLQTKSVFRIVDHALVTTPPG